MPVGRATRALAKRARSPRRRTTSAAAPGLAGSNGLLIQGSPFDGGSLVVTQTPGAPGRCALNCTNNFEVYSFHTGGALAVFADGSVHFLKAGMNIRVLAGLATRAGGEVVSADDY